MNETSIKLILEFIILRLIWTMNKQSLTEKEALAIECPRIIFFMVGRKRNWPYYLSRGGLNMGDKTDFFEEYKSANGMNELKKTVVKEDEKRMALSLAEENAFRECLNDPCNSWFKPLFLTMLDTGLRVGEMTGLRWGDIDFENGMISVNHTLVYFDKGYNPVTKKKCHYAINSSKTKNSIRTVPMTKELVETLRNLQAFQKENEYECNTIVDGYSDFAFFNKMFTVYNQATLNKAIRRMRRDYNLEQLDKLEKGKIKEEEMVLLPSFSCHVLRHTAATRLCEAGVNTRFIMDMLGHADIRTTMNIYVDVTKNFQKTEMEKFESYKNQN